MSKNGGLVVAFLLGLIVASIGTGAWLVAPSTQAYEQCDSTEGSDTAGSKHRDDVRERRSDLAGVPALVERIIANPEPCDGKDNEKRDLAAQEASATWAFWIVFFAALQLVVSGFGLWALLRTIHQGEEGLNRARDANRIAEENGRLQLRAYLSISSVSLGFNSGKISMQPTFRNSGQSPALGVKWHARLHMIPKDGEATTGVSNPDDRDFWYDIPAQDTRESLYTNCGDFFFGPAAIEAFQDDRSVAVIVRVFANGKDVFGDEISARENFIKIFRDVPEIGDNVTMDPGTHFED